MTVQDIARRATRRLVVALIAPASVVALAVFPACGDGDSGATSNGPLSFYEPVGSGSDSALLAGELTVEGNCLYISGVLPVFPEGKASWDVESGELHFNEQTYAPGDHVELPGGRGLSADEFDFSVPPAPECDTSDFFVVGNI